MLNCNNCEYAQLINFQDCTSGRGCNVARSAIEAVYHTEVGCGLAGLALLADPSTKESDNIFALGIMAKIVELPAGIDENQLALDFPQ